MEAITARPKFNPNSLRTSKLPSGVVPNIPKGSLVTKTFQTELVADNVSNGTQYFYGLCVGQAYSPAIGFTNLIIFSDSTVAEYKDTLQCVSRVLTPRQINSLRRKYYKEKGYKLGKHAKMLKFIESRNHQTTLTQAFRAPANM